MESSALAGVKIKAGSSVVPLKLLESLQLLQIMVQPNFATYLNHGVCGCKLTSKRTGADCGLEMEIVGTDYRSLDLKM